MLIVWAALRQIRWALRVRSLQVSEGRCANVADYSCKKGDEMDIHSSPCERIKRGAYLTLPLSPAGKNPPLPDPPA
jgi:hypothetical protein